jgi:DNA-binding MarR family transcriptional regulator
LTQILWVTVTFGLKAETYPSKYSEAKMNNTDMIGVAVTPTQETKNIKPVYLEALTLVERLHRRLLDVIKDEFDRQGRSDINAVQALLLYNLGDSELTAGELRTRGYYLGSNVSYNLKKLVDMGYIHHQRSRTDRRSVRVSLTEQGRDVAQTVDALYERHTQSLEQIGEIDSESFETLNKALHRLERFWTDQILYRL